MKNNNLSQRIHDELVELNGSSLLNFFETRAQKYDVAKPFVSVLYQDQNPRLAEQRDQYEKRKILPLLNLNGSQRVLDVGCGVGRWADALSPLIESYFGLDFSPKLIEIAKQRHMGQKHINFRQLSADEISSAAVQNQQFDRILISGLLLYLNDDQLLRCLQGIISVAADNCLIYIREPLSITVRLTLNEFESSELGQSYNAIYRSVTDMQNFISQLLKPSGFSPISFEALYPEDSLNNRTDTKQFYLLTAR